MVLAASQVIIGRRTHSRQRCARLGRHGLRPGYSSQQHFITDFRKVLGETPLQYRATALQRQSTQTEWD